MSSDENARWKQVIETLARHGLNRRSLPSALEKLLAAERREGHEPSQEPLRVAEALRRALEEMGGAFPTIARVASGRRDVIPDVFARTLSEVHDRAEPVDLKELKPWIEGELCRSMEAAFEQFDAEPVASACLSQTHRARLRPELAAGASRDVAVKLLKPGAGRRIEIDLHLLQEGLAWLERSAVDGKADLTQLVTDIRVGVREELDLAREAEDKRELGRLLAGFGRVRVPTVLSELCGTSILVMDWPGRQAPRDPQLPNARETAEQLWRAGLQQILVEGRFVSDWRWEELCVDAQGRAVLGGRCPLSRVTQETRLALTALLLALAEGDGERVAAACVELGVAGPSFREGAFRAEVRRHVGRAAGRCVGEVARELARTAHRYGVLFSQEVLAVGNALAGLESVCRRLAPQLDPLSGARQVAVSVLSGQMREELSSTKLLVAALELRALLTQTPSSLRRLISRASSNELRLGVDIGKVERLVAALEKLANRLTLGMLSAALILASALLMRLDGAAGLRGAFTGALVGLVAGVGLGLYVVVRIVREDSF